MLHNFFRHNLLHTEKIKERMTYLATVVNQLWEKVCMSIKKIHLLKAVLFSATQRAVCLVLNSFINTIIFQAHSFIASSIQFYFPFSLLE